MGSAAGTGPGAGRGEGRPEPLGIRPVHALLRLRRPHLADRSGDFRRRHPLAEAGRGSRTRSADLGRLLHRCQRHRAARREPVLVLVRGRPEGRAAAGPGPLLRCEGLAEGTQFGAKPRPLQELGRTGRGRSVCRQDRVVAVPLLSRAGSGAAAAAGSGALGRRNPLAEVTHEPNSGTRRTGRLRREGPGRAGGLVRPRLLLDALHRPRPRREPPHGPGPLDRRRPLGETARGLRGHPTLGLEGGLRPDRGTRTRRRNAGLVRRRRHGPPRREPQRADRLRDSPPDLVRWEK